MSDETSVTVRGNLTADPELRSTSAGTVTTFTVASTPRVYDREAGTWSDGATVFLRCSAWRELAERAARCLHRADRVVVVGRLRQHSFDGADGVKRTVVEVDVDDIGASLRYDDVTVSRSPGPATEQ